VPLDHANCPDPLWTHATAGLGQGAALGEKHGYRNAQATVIAPTGTIGLVMDCDTTGIEPDFALVKFKKLAGGGYFKIINRAVPEALEDAGLHRSPDRPRSKPTRSATARWPGARHQPHLARPRASPTQAIEKDRRRAGLRLRHQVRVQQVDAGRGLLHRRARLHRRAAERSLRPALALGFSKAEIEAANTMSAGR
jgi:ribonucleoside-diphosphate reductase alpha chain